MQLLPKLVSEYTEFSVFGKKVTIPYSMVQVPNDPYDPTKVTRTTRFKHYAGKGTPKEIKKTLLATAEAQNFDLKKATSAEIHQFMLDNGIGIDCSGYVYNILDKYLFLTQKKTLGSFIKLYPGLKGRLEQVLFSYKRVRRCSAATLTSDLNTIEIATVEEFQPGDMIRLTLPTWRGKHIALITEVTPDKITYTHSGERSAEDGPHLATIKIVNKKKSLEHQEWLEKHQNGDSYKSYAYHPEKGDSVRRLRWCTLSV